jgi:thienamycin biosynthesis protein ThnN
MGRADQALGEQMRHPQESDSALAGQVAHVMAIHFDPDAGAPYWLQRQQELGIDVRREIRSASDLVRLGPMDQEVLSCRPIEDFIPRSMLDRRAELVLGETAGTLGRPKHAVHRRDEFHAAFVEPFLAAADRVEFPRGLNWLFVGPSGPHIIGKAANACANAMGSPDCFTIDLDPRWAKKLPPGSFAWDRYVAHLEDQALTVLESQSIGVIFSTPVVLESLGHRMDRGRREAVRGIHLGGLSVSASQRRVFVELFPRAVILSGYGNTLFGMMPELAWSEQDGFSYYPQGQRLVVRVVPLEGDSDEDRLPGEVEYGRRGQVVISRLDETQVIVNMMERDTAVRTPAPAWAIEDGFLADGLQDPKPIVSQAMKPAVGLY